MSAPVEADEPAIRVVVCDDHPVVRQGLRSFLETQGFDVVGEAADGAEAERLVAAERPDVLLTDLVMAGVDGVEGIRRIRENGADLLLLEPQFLPKQAGNATYAAYVDAVRASWQVREIGSRTIIATIH